MMCASETRRSADALITAPRRSRFALLSLTAFVFALALGTAPAVRAQTYQAEPNDQAPPQDDNGTVVVGGDGGGVTVDLSVLNDLGRTGEGRHVLFPDPDFARDQGRIHLTPPGAKRVHLTPPGGKSTARSPRHATARRKPRMPSPDIQAARPAPKPAAPPALAPDSDRGDLATVGPAESTPPAPPSIAKAPPAATAAPTPMAPTKPEPAPTAQSTAQSAARAPEPFSAADRNAVPPPPPPMASTDTSPDMPPVTPAPRTDVNEAPIQPPPAASSAEQQTASLPPAATAFAPGTTKALAFPAGEAKLPKDAEDTLKAAAQALAADKKLRIELKAYASGDKNNESQARRLSLSRALSVRSYLIKQGVQATRIDVRALGNNVPSGSADRVDITVASR